MKDTINVGFLVFPQVTQLDFLGPATVLGRVPGARIHLVWKTLEPVTADTGFAVVPTTTFDECPVLDVLCAPGGIGVVEQINDMQTLAFLRAQGEAARYVTSVCNGSLLLGAAGLITGHRCACHWMWREHLLPFGAEPVASRVVLDRNRLSGGGVTSGIDFGLTLASELAGAEVSRMIQLGLEYDPQPPFDCGSPEKAGSDRVSLARAALAPRVGEIADSVARAARRLRPGH